MNQPKQYNDGSIYADLVQITKTYVMPYGKFKGETIGDIATVNHDYLTWLSENSRDPIFKYALTMFLNSEESY